MNDLFVGRAERTRAAIAHVWDMAGLAPEHDRPRIIPLDILVRSFPLTVEEVAKLTRHTAASVLSARSGQAIAPPRSGAGVELAGYLYAYPYRTSVQGYVLIEYTDIVERRRFSVAHELGHYLLHFLHRIAEQRARGHHLYMQESLTYAGTGDEPRDIPMGETVYARGAAAPATPLPEEQERMEVEANQFAAELLMPEQACRALVAHFGKRASPRRLSTEFLVSPAAMRWRLTNLGLVPS